VLRIDESVDNLHAFNLAATRQGVKDAISNAPKKLKTERAKRSGVNKPSEWELFSIAMEALAEDHDIIPPSQIKSCDLMVDTGTGGCERPPESLDLSSTSTQIEPGLPAPGPSTQAAASERSRLTFFQKEYFEKFDTFLDLYEQEIAKK